MAELHIGDLVELTKAADSAPPGARGGVTDILSENRVIVEVMTLPSEPVLNRIVVVPPGMLRVIKGQTKA